MVCARVPPPVQVRTKFRGILNGVDAQDWNPANDPLLPANFNAKLPAGKAVCKQFLQQVREREGRREAAGKQLLDVVFPLSLLGAPVSPARCTA